MKKHKSDINDEPYAMYSDDPPSLAEIATVTLIVIAIVIGSIVLAEMGGPQ